MQLGNLKTGNTAVPSLLHLFYLIGQYPQTMTLPIKQIYICKVVSNEVTQVVSKIIYLFICLFTLFNFYFW